MENGFEIRGLVTQSRDGDRYLQYSITCCSGVDDIYVGGECLYDVLENYFDLKGWNPSSNDDAPSYEIMMRYVVLNTDPGDDIDFEDLAAEIAINALYNADYVYGCYSEWTCGYGGFDYVNNEGHSLFKELTSYRNKYVAIKLNVVESKE